MKDSIRRFAEDMNKKFGVNSLVSAEKLEESLIKIDTGSISLNLALGGGYPIGRFIQISGGYSSGKSTLVYHAIANMQKMVKEVPIIKKGVVVGTEESPMSVLLIQSEFGAYTQEYGDIVGIDPDYLIINQSAGMEESLEIARRAQESESVDLIVIDSLETLIPIKEYDSDMADSIQMGIKPKLFGEYLRKFQAINNRLSREEKLPCTVIGINQLREAIGKYGDPEYCLHYDTPIVFVDGRSIPIGEVVNNKIKGKVWAYNENLDIFEPCEILNWKDNGVIDTTRDFYTISANGVGSKNGVYSVTVTHDHELLTDSGWKIASELSLSDKLVTNVEYNVNGTLEQFLAGTLVGDCTLVKCHKNTSYLKIQDSKNAEYVNWKISKLNKILNFEKYPSSNIWRSECSVEFSEIKSELGSRDVKYFFDRYSDLGLAVYYCDDGSLSHNKFATISMKRYRKCADKLDYVVNEFSKRGMSCRANIKNGLIVFSKEGSNEFFNRICKYVPNCMQYKIPNEFKEKYINFELNNFVVNTKKYVDILSINIASSRKLRKKHRYNIEVANNRNFLAGGTGNGVVVHNCPGGRALAYAATVDMRIRKGDVIAIGSGENKSIIGHEVKFKVHKNKLGVPYRTGKFDLYFDYGGAVEPAHIDNMKELIVEGIAYGVIERSGAWFSYKDVKTQGAEAMINTLKKNSKLMKQLTEELYKVALEEEKVEQDDE